MIQVSYINAGWWFGTCFIFHFTYGMSSFPTDELIFFRGVGSTTNQIYNMHVYIYIYIQIIHNVLYIYMYVCIYIYMGCPWLLYIFICLLAASTQMPNVFRSSSPRWTSYALVRCLRRQLWRFGRLWDGISWWNAGGFFRYYTQIIHIVIYTNRNWEVDVSIYEYIMDFSIDWIERWTGGRDVWYVNVNMGSLMHKLWEFINYGNSVDVTYLLWYLKWWKRNLQFIENKQRNKSESNETMILVIFTDLYRSLESWLLEHQSLFPEDPCMEYLPTLTPKVI